MAASLGSRLILNLTGGLAGSILCHALIVAHDVGGLATLMRSDEQGLAAFLLLFFAFFAAFSGLAIVMATTSSLPGDDSG